MTNGSAVDKGTFVVKWVTDLSCHFSGVTLGTVIGHNTECPRLPSSPSTWHLETGLTRSGRGSLTGRAENSFTG